MNIGDDKNIDWWKVAKFLEECSIAFSKDAYDYSDGGDISHPIVQRKLAIGEIMICLSKAIYNGLE